MIKRLVITLTTTNRSSRLSSSGRALFGRGGNVTIRDAVGNLPRDRRIRRPVIGRLVGCRGLAGKYIFARDPVNLFSL
jgi:hypothetical protein